MNPPPRYPLVTFIFLVILTTHFGSVTSQSDDAYICLNNGNYTRESSYRADLNSLLRSLSSNVGNSGFYNTSVGQVNAIVLCRGDIQLHQCRSCIDHVTDDMLQLCPNQMQAIRWSELCMLRYSDEFIFGNMSTSPAVMRWNDQNNVTSDVDGYKRVRRKLMGDLFRKAANGSAMQKVAADMAPFGYNKIFALVQCTPDLSAVDCYYCLASAINAYGRDNTRAGLTIYTPSCYLRYESAPFYNKTRLLEPVEPVEPPSSGKNDDNTTRNLDDNTTRNLIIIVIATVMGLILALCVGIFTIRRLKRKTKGNPDRKIGKWSRNSSQKIIQKFRSR
ncbi:hypothetical protein CDL12_23451 [Handroanthus impetiginosus]|uniref:Gnk2-homologous domain-containing protein n=1 Tax=Handroanthus impetiginosus TaxID=429701 RepID=A0A2G9GFE6_9LAMI|nr:hypothetical protein CDL12_23451 [Handroanthus impetiginosus]